MPTPAIKFLLSFAFLVFVISFGDAIMAYYAPVFISEWVVSPLMMGLIISASSAFGLAADFLMSKSYPEKNYLFFIKWAILGGLSFPLFFLLPPRIPVMILAMAVWGIYYEFFLFGNFHAVKSLVDYRHHAFAWGTVSVFKSAAYLLGPVVAILLLTQSSRGPLYGALTIHLIALFGLIVFTRAKGYRPAKHFPSRHRSFSNELKIWKTLNKRLWPLLIFAMVLAIVDAAFWTVGAVLSEELRQIHPLGGTLLIAYMLPSLFVGVIAAKAAEPFGKKRIAFISGAISGVLLMAAGLVPSITLFILLIFFSSAFMSLAVPEILAAFEDYIERLGDMGNDLIGLENSFTSLSFIIGPVMAGGVAAVLGYQQSFAVFGLLLFIVSIAMLAIVPRKVKLPQGELKKL